MNERSPGLMERWKSGLPLLLDGATGTQLEKRNRRSAGPLWSAEALRSCPEAVLHIHREYVTAGAELLTANTFRTNPRTLAKAGWEDGAALNQAAIALCRHAAAEAGHPVWVAASVAPVEDCYSPHLTPSDADLREEHRLMMTWLSSAQPDLVLIETMNTAREARIAAQAAAEASMPFVVSFVPAESGALLSGEGLAAAVEAVAVFGPLAIGLNCAPPSGLSRVLPSLGRATSLPLVAYGHLSDGPPLPGWSFSEWLSPEAYAPVALEWIRAGARIVGGCCGTSPAHIRALAHALRG